MPQNKNRACEKCGMFFKLSTVWVLIFPIQSCIKQLVNISSITVLHFENKPRIFFTYQHKL